jgi:hypothetical protein
VNSVELVEKLGEVLEEMDKMSDIEIDQLSNLLDEKCLYLQPFQEQRSNLTMKGWGDVRDLKVLRHFDESSGAMIFSSVWETTSIYEKIKFLIEGKVTINIYGNAHPPISIGVGDGCRE